MYSPPATHSSGRTYEESSTTKNEARHSQQAQATVTTTEPSPPSHKLPLPSLPPFPSLVSSLAERGQHQQDYPSAATTTINSSRSSSNPATASPHSSHRETSTLPPPFQSASYHHHHLLHQQPPHLVEVESATRSSWNPSDNQRESKAYSDSYRRAGPSHLPGMSGQVEWESSIRTGSSASTSEPPLSPSHPAEKRRRLSAAHDAVHGIEAGHASSTTEDPHDHTLQIDELSPHIHMTESASPPGGGGGGSDEKGANGRTLKQTKRAAQNRAAQQAFRKRKEERIRELEEKERVLNALVARENEIVRREKLLAERERSSHANQNNGLSTSPSLPQGPATSNTSASASTSATNDWDRAFASAPVASPIQHIAERLEASNRANEILRKELEHLKDQLEDKGALVDSLRRSLEDLGAENRSLRDAIGRQSLEAQHQQHQQSRASS